MKFFRRADEPTEREAFLLSALTASGFTEGDVNLAFEAKATDFLKALDKSSNLAAELDSASKFISSFGAALEASGFTKEHTASADTFKAALSERIKSEAAREAVEISAARGIKPVTSSVNDTVTDKIMKRSDFEALSHQKRNEYIRNGGKVID